MIDFLKVIQKQSDIECVIGDYQDELTHSLPLLLLSPISEKWTYNLLGVPDNKLIKFKLNYFQDHIYDNFEAEYTQAIDDIKSLLTNPKVKKDIVEYVTTEIKTELLEESTIINVIAEITLKITRRS